MKKIFSAVLLVILGMYTNAQLISVNKEKNNTYYFDKSESQKTIAWILLGAGAVAATTGYITLVSQLNNSIAGNNDVAGILIIVGGASMLASIPFFISSSRNMQREILFSIGPKMEQNDKLIQLYAGKYQPAISLKINLK